MASWKSSAATTCLLYISIERSAFSQAIAREAQAASTEQAVDPFAPKGEPEQEKKYRVRFFADGTKEQLGKLIAFMNENNIKYYAQELKQNTYNLTRMNLVMRGILPDNICLLYTSC